MTTPHMSISQLCVYIMTNEQHSLLYTGRTGNLKHRIAQHRSGNGGVTTRRHNLVRLVYYELLEEFNSSQADREGRSSAARRRNASA